MEKPTAKKFGSMTGPAAGVSSGLSEVSRFKTSDSDPAEDPKTHRPKQEGAPSGRRIVK